MTEEVKEILIREHPNGLRVVLDQKFPSDCDAAGDLTGINCEDLATLPLDVLTSHRRPSCFSEGAPATFASVGRDSRLEDPGRPDSITQRFNLKIRSSGLPPWNCATRYGSRASSGGGSEVDVMMY